MSAVNVDGQPVQAGRRGAKAGFLGVDASSALYCGLQKNECQCGTCDGRCGPEDGCPCLACFASVLRRDSNVGINVDGRPVSRGTAPNSFYCGHLGRACKCGTCDGRCGPLNGCPCDACEAFALAQQSTVRNDEGVRAWKGPNHYGCFSDSPVMHGLFYCGRLMNQCRCGRCDGRCGPSSGCPCNSCLVLDRLRSATLLNTPEGVPVWLGSHGQAGDTGLPATSMYYCGRRDVKNCSCGKCPDRRCGPAGGCPCYSCLALVCTMNDTVRKKILQSSERHHALNERLLHAAVARNRYDIVDSCLSFDSAYVNSTTADGVPLLCVAVRCYYAKIVERLLSAGANPDLKCRSGETALYLSASLGQYDVVSLLLKYKADPNLACTISTWRFGGFQPTRTPLEVAATKKHEPIIRLLLLAGANPSGNSGTFPYASESSYALSKLISVLSITFISQIMYF